MTQEDNDLLLKDLCGRLPYGIICTDSNNIGKLNQISIPHEICVLECGDSVVCSIADCKPYLFPMSSMTEEQEEELRKLCTFNCLDYLTLEAVDWLNAHHFDFRGLIEKGLAIDCTNLNIY